jgi:hypothetical protein
MEGMMMAMFGPVPAWDGTPRAKAVFLAGTLALVFGVYALISKDTISVFGRQIRKSSIGFFSLIAATCIAAWLLR